MRPDLDRYLLAFGAARDRVTTVIGRPEPRFLVEGRHLYGVVTARDAEQAAREWVEEHGGDDPVKVSPIGVTVIYDVTVDVGVKARSVGK